MTGWLCDGATEWGGRPVARWAKEVAARRRAALTGTICSVRVRDDNPPSLEADVEDETGTVTLVWVGRREVAGVVPGAVVRIEGTVLDRRGHLVVLNPLYQFATGAR